MKRIVFLLTLLLCVILFQACDKGNTFSTLNLNITGLSDVGENYTYEGWIMVDGSPKTTGVFNVNASGELSSTFFSLDADDLNSATAFILTIEPFPDPDPSPSDVHVLAGDFSTNSATLTVSHPAALGTDFTDATGTYILATPTDGADTNENAGVWWIDPVDGPSAGLDLPTLPAGWKYEGWVVMGGVPLSTGTFTSVSGSDDAAPYSGAMAGPPFPGEDFLMNAPDGMTFPASLMGTTTVISVEPDPDNSPMPYALKPLVGAVASDAAVHTPYMMMNNAAASNPTGTAGR
ncbi:hypothetical protein V8G61_09480 [Gaetbulibacter sp. M240]|uniref:hypothetical protein n=1 Tax=Gaetbulibacter sp. M240 TaxID=3126511 RepID=UPI00374FC863